MSDHDRWEELAAGFALAALEPEDEQAFAAHVRHCERCQRDLAALHEVTAGLAQAVEPADPPEDLGARIAAAAAAERPPRQARPAAEPEPHREPHRPRAPRRDDPPRVAEPRERRTPPFRVAALAAAAAGVAVLALGVWNVQLRSDAASRREALDRRTAALGCLAAPDTAKFAMSGGEGQRGSACVSGGQVYVVAERFAANDTDKSVYVLWWVDGTKTAHPVERFDVTSRDTAVYALPFAVRPGEVHAMAVSLEPGRALPAAPTHQVATSASSTT
jgi:hypothetical protein